MEEKSKKKSANQIVKEIKRKLELEYEKIKNIFIQSHLNL